MTKGRDSDKKMLMETPKEKLIDLMFMHMRNLWAVDGLYFLGIEEMFGAEGATEIDSQVWKVMGKIEARRLKKLLEIEGSDISTLMHALKYSSWSLDLEDKEFIEEKDRAILRNKKCRVQQNRLKKGLVEFPCKKVRWGFLKSFVVEINPNLEVKCNLCPPDSHGHDLWCEWEFVFNEK